MPRSELADLVVHAWAQIAAAVDETYNVVWGLEEDGRWIPSAYAEAVSAARRAIRRIEGLGEGARI